MPTVEEVHKELDLIQDIIKRMANNSFKVKAWLMTIIAGVLTFSMRVLFPLKNRDVQESSSIVILFFLLVLTIVSWYLDAYYLRTERIYRNLYLWVVRNRSHTNNYLYDLSTFNRVIEGQSKDIREDVSSVFRIMISSTLSFFYCIPIIFISTLLIICIYHI
ncbi:MAG: hypothetical protein ACEPOV_01075 [Hyphomicrobiales bacterium]